MPGGRGRGRGRHRAEVEKGRGDDDDDGRDHSAFRDDGCGDDSAVLAASTVMMSSRPSFLRIVPSDSSSDEARPSSPPATRGGGGSPRPRATATSPSSFSSPAGTNKTDRTTTAIGDDSLLVLVADDEDHHPAGLEEGCSVLVLNLSITRNSPLSGDGAGGGNSWSADDAEDREEGIECTFAAVCRVSRRGGGYGGRSKGRGGGGGTGRRGGGRRRQHHRNKPSRSSPSPASPGGDGGGDDTDDVLPVVVGRLLPKSLESRFLDSSTSSNSSVPLRGAEVEVKTRTVVVPLEGGRRPSHLAKELFSVLVADASSVVLGPGATKGGELGGVLDVRSMSRGQVRMLSALTRLALSEEGGGASPSSSASTRGVLGATGGRDGGASTNYRSGRTFAVGDAVDVTFMGTKRRFAIHAFVPRDNNRCIIVDDPPMDSDGCIRDRRGEDQREGEGKGKRSEEDVSELGRAVGGLTLGDGGGDDDGVSKVLRDDRDADPSQPLDDAESLVRRFVSERLRLRLRARRAPLLCRIDRGTNITFVDGKTTDDVDDGNRYNRRSLHGMQLSPRIGGEVKGVDGSCPKNANPNRPRREWESDREEETDESSPRYVAGLSDVMDEVEGALVPSLRHPELFEVGDGGGAIRPPRGVLLYGPGGVGKSALARQIGHRLVSSSTSPTSSIERSDVSRPPPLPVCVRTVQCGTLVSSVVGESEGRLVRLFRSAELRCVEEGVSTLLILDDVHLVCPRRGGGGGVSSSSSTDRVAATLLALMDGIGGGGRLRRHRDGRHRIGYVAILAITTDPSLLDPALRRPGRLDREVEVPIPDDAARAEILSFQLRRCLDGACVPCLAGDEGAMLALAKRAGGFTGADTLLAIREASRQALLRSSKMPSRSSNNDSFSGDHSHGDGGEEVVVGRCEVTLEDLQRAISKSNPTSIRGVAVEVPAVHWSDIGGMHDVKRLLREAVELPSTHPHLFDSLGIAPPGGVLLYGPPGCSKTLMARALATEGGMNFLAVKGPELLSKWLGESERTLASLFRRARRASPCVIFFDEIDAIALRRGGGDGGSSSGGERLLSQLLTELDGVSSSSMMPRRGQNERVVVVGATNRPDLLDAALTRPGRIDRMIYVGIPDRESREMILEIGLKGRCCHGDIDIPHLATESVTGGYSGAELVSICRDAALRALEEYEKGEVESNTNNNGTSVDHPMIAMRHMTDSIRDTKHQISSEMLQFYSTFRNER